MRSVQRFLLALGVIGGLSGVFGEATPVFACSCAMATPAEHFANATAVFVGTVSNVAVDGGNNLVDFNVSESRKGPSAENITLRTHQQGSACGFEFEEGNEYLVYAYGEEGQLGTGLCTGTSLLAVAHTPIDEPSIVKDATESNRMDSIVTVAIAVVAAFGAGVLTARLVRRKNKT